MNEMTVTYNEQSYIPIYNSQTGYYEIELQAPQNGGVYEANITFTDIFEEEYTDTVPIQIWAKEPIKIDNNKVFMWIFDYYTFDVKDIVELSDYEINIDEETNAKSLIKVLNKTTAKAEDIIAIKKNNEVVYWGTLEEIQNENGKRLYEYISKYITNIFNQNIELFTETKIKNDNYVWDGLYNIQYSRDLSKAIDIATSSQDNNAKAIVYTNNHTSNQLFGISKQPNGYYKIMAAHSHKYITVDENLDIIQYEELNNDSQLWQIIKTGDSKYSFISKLNGKYMSVLTDSEYLKANNSNLNDYAQFKLEIQKDEDLIKYIGIEDQIKRAILLNFVENADSFINKNYLQVIAKTHTTKQISISNVENRIYNLHTWMTNCTQNYNIIFDFNIKNDKLVMTIEVKDYDKELIDIKAQPISDYSEVFETKVVSKVIVLTSTNTYILYLLNDRTTTTDGTNPNRAAGIVETIYTENYEDAAQKALDTIRANTYNHNITFNYLERLIKIGTPIAIKTKESLIYDTYISGIKLTPKKFIEYTCGNIRVGLIEKLNQERNK